MLEADVRRSLGSRLLTLAAVVLVVASTGCGKGKNAAPLPTPKSLAISNHLAAIAAAGEPVTLDQLDRYYRHPPSAQDAGPLYLEAFAALRSSDVRSPTSKAKPQNALPLLIQAADRPACRYPIALTNGALALLPHLSQLKAGAEFLGQEAVSQAARGNTEAATTTLLAGLRLARSLDHEPLQISKRVQLAALAVTCESLLGSLRKQGFTDAQLLRLMVALHESEPAIGFHRAMVGERAILVAVFQSSDEGLATAMAAEGGGASPVLSLRSYRLEGHLEGDFAFALDFMSNLVATVALPYPQALDAAASLKVPGFVEATSGSRVFSAMLLPKPAELVGKGAQAMAHLRICQAVLAVERYRLKHGGALPASLTEVAAELPKGIPPDPFDGQPLRYRQISAGGYAVWSSGTNRKDDGGSSEGPDSRNPLDLVKTMVRE
jgi:hypothetical protein